MNTEYYDDPTYAICSQCLNISECKSYYNTYIYNKSGNTQTFYSYLHRNLSSRDCIMFNSIGTAIFVVIYFAIQIHYVNTAGECLEKIVAHNRKIY